MGFLGTHSAVGDYFVHYHTRSGVIQKWIWFWNQFAWRMQYPFSFLILSTSPLWRVPSPCTAVHEGSVSLLALGPIQKGTNLNTSEPLYLLTNMNIMWAQACQHESSRVPFKGGSCSWCTQPNFILMYINRESSCWISQLLSSCNKNKIKSAILFSCQHNKEYPESPR